MCWSCHRTATRHGGSSQTRLWLAVGPLFSPTPWGPHLISQPMDRPDEFTRSVTLQPFQYPFGMCLLAHPSRQEFLQNQMLTVLRPRRRVSNWRLHQRWQSPAALPVRWQPEVSPRIEPEGLNHFVNRSSLIWARLPENPARDANDL